MWHRDHRVPGLFGNRSYMRKVCAQCHPPTVEAGGNIFAMLCHVPWDHLFKVYSYFMGKDALPFCLHVCLYSVYYRYTVPVEARRVQWTIWDWTYRWL